MKKILFIFISCLVLISCYKKDSKSINDCTGLSGGGIYVKEVTYKNHSYLEFKDNGIYGQGWVHNPDCKCIDEI